jgi:hypothetical protein
MKSLRLSRVTFATSTVAALITLVAACSGGNAPPPSVYLDSTLGINAMDEMTTQSCTVQAAESPFFTIGTISGAGIPSPVLNGASSNGQPITINCSVTSSGSGFNVNLEVSVGMTGGITLFSTTPITDTQGPQGGIQATFTTVTGANGISYESPSTMACTLTLSSLGNPPITAGRIWGSLTCPILTDPEANATCYGTAELLFQNCDG